MRNRVRYIMEGFDDPNLAPGVYPATFIVTTPAYGTIDIIVRPVSKPPVATPPAKTPPLRRLRRHVTTGVRPMAGPNPYEHI